MVIIAIIVAAVVVFLRQNLDSCSRWMKVNATVTVAYAPMIGADWW